MKNQGFSLQGFTIGLSPEETEATRNSEKQLENDEILFYILVPQIIQHQL